MITLLSDTEFERLWKPEPAGATAQNPAELILTGLVQSQCQIRCACVRVLESIDLKGPMTACIGDTDVWETTSRALGVRRMLEGMGFDTADISPSFGLVADFQSFPDLFAVIEHAILHLWTVKCRSESENFCFGLDHDDLMEVKTRSAEHIQYFKKLL